MTSSETDPTATFPSRTEMHSYADFFWAAFIFAHGAPNPILERFCLSCVSHVMG